MTKKLYRSRENRVLTGLLGGVAEYFDTDPVLIRLTYLMISVFTGVLPGIVAYILGSLIVPSRHLVVASTRERDDTEAV